MNARDLRKFFLSIVLPSILAISLFIISFYVLILPSVEKNLMEGKKEMISELTNTAWSLVDEYYNEFQSGNIGEKEAKEMAAIRVGNMRYGNEKKDYFWITDMQPFMVMHPYRQELDATDLSEYTDPQGKKLFVEAVDSVTKKGEGYINYMWQWKDDSTQIVPKLSYVKGFPQWNWIIGTGIYLEDVKQEIKLLEGRLFRIVFIIILIIAAFLLFIIRQSMIIENGRKDAENKLQLSRHKYKSLVESSTIGTLMMFENKIIYANQKFLDLTDLQQIELEEKGIENLFDLSWNRITESFKEPGKSVSLESKITSSSNQIDVLLSVSMIQYNQGYSYIIVINELSMSNVAERQSQVVNEDIQASVLLMNQVVSPLIRESTVCNINSTVSDAINMLKRKKQTALLVQQDEQVIGIVTASDILKRATDQNIKLASPVTFVMTSPVIYVTENCLISEAIFTCRENKIAYLQVVNSKGRSMGILNYNELLELQPNYVNQLFIEIEKAESASELRDIYIRINVIIEMLINSGAKSRVVTTLISTFTDNINSKVVQLALETYGEAPCEFCFMAMGSQGRKEQTLTTDQDNGIITSDDFKNDETGKAYFLKLALKINNDLNAIGYKLCPGNMMASNPEWIKPLKDWKETFIAWVNTSDSNNLIDVNIFFDFRGIYGKLEFANELKDHLNNITVNKGVFFYQLSHEITRFKSPIGVFGKIMGEHDTPDSNLIDIKKLLLPFTSFARLYALRAKVVETNTLSRFELLRNSEDMTNELIDECIEAYDILMGARLRLQTNSLMKGENPSNTLDVNQLTSIEQTTMRKVLSLTSDILTKVKLDFKGTF